MKDAPPAQLQPGWTPATSKDGVVSLGVPSGWRVGTDAANGLADLAAKLGNSGIDNQAAPEGSLGAEMQKIAQRADENAKKQEAEALAALEKKGVVLNVINGSKPIPGESRTRFYLKVTHGNGPIAIADALDVEKLHYHSPPPPTDATLPIGPAKKFSAHDSLRDGMTLHQMSYVVIDGPNTYTLRFVTEEAPETIESIADAVAQTLRIKPSK